MKDFFEDLGKRLGETAETVTNKAGEAIEIQRLKSKVRRLARENAVDLMEIGRMVYDRYKEGGEVDEEAESLCESISSREASMNGYNKKIAGLKGAFECSSCGKMVAQKLRKKMRRRKSLKEKYATKPGKKKRAKKVTA